MSVSLADLIQREKYAGPGFYTFEITEIGASFVQLNSQEAYLVKDRLALDDLYFLEKVDMGEEAFASYIKEQDVDSLKVSVILAKLIRYGYLKESGFIRRKVSMTKSGKSIVQKYSFLLNANSSATK